GLDMDAAGDTAEKTLAELGICFLFAKNHHPAMGRIQPIRKKIGKRTIFNLMGPLSNPARVKSQLIGIARPAYVPIYAGAMARLGTGKSLIVSGDEGLDEMSLAGGNEVAVVTGNEFVMQRLHPHDVEIQTAPIEAIRGDDAVHNAAALKALLNGAPGPYRDAVLLNSAGALLVAQRGKDWAERIAMAVEALDSGAAKRLLERWIEMAK
ncbi:MAG: anthranilate phosphoribosyltransferase, partial [Pseudomonadota bacterium]